LQRIFGASKRAGGATQAHRGPGIGHFIGSFLGEDPAIANQRRLANAVLTVFRVADVIIDDDGFFWHRFCFVYLLVEQSAGGRV
jgi:hypothetical protein